MTDIHWPKRGDLYVDVTTDREFVVQDVAHDDKGALVVSYSPPTNLDQRYTQGISSFTRRLEGSKDQCRYEFVRSLL